MDEILAQVEEVYDLPVVFDCYIIYLSKYKFNHDWWNWEVKRISDNKSLGAGSSPTFSSAINVAMKEYDIPLLTSEHPQKKRLKIQVFWILKNFWVGLYYSKTQHTLYFCPLPTVTIAFIYG